MRASAVAESSCCEDFPVAAENPYPCCCDPRSSENDPPAHYSAAVAGIIIAAASVEIAATEGYYYSEQQNGDVEPAGDDRLPSLGSRLDYSSSCAGVIKNN